MASSTLASCASKAAVRLPSGTRCLQLGKTGETEELRCPSFICTRTLPAWSGETFMLSSMPIWVRPVGVALAVQQPHAEAPISQRPNLNLGHLVISDPSHIALSSRYGMPR